MLLFAYGTLRKGGHNHWRLADIPAKGITTTSEKMYMVAQPSSSWPFVSRHQILPGTTPVAITGELYEVPDAIIKSLDDLEFRYVRTSVQTSCGQTAQMYLLEDKILLKELGACGLFVPLKSGDWFGGPRQ